jgi:hypothetical protein
MVAPTPHIPLHHQQPGQVYNEVIGSTRSGIKHICIIK